jgi:ABC-type Mn2+/Zn2+ transport system permease subunit
MIDAFADTLSYTFNQRALLAAVMIGFVNGFFGSYVVLRRASLFAGALSHTLFPGIALGAVFAGVNPISALVGACIMALLVGLGSQGLANTTRADINTVLAVFWTAAFAAGLVVLERLNKYVDVDAFLFGNILGVSNFDIWFVFLAGFVVLSAMVLLQRPIILMVFSPDVAATQGIAVKKLDYLMAALLVLVMITSLQAVGTILTLGLLVAPAAILDLFVESPRRIMWGGGCLGAGLAGASVFLSNALNVQTGALIVILFGLLYLGALILSPRHGLLGKVLLHRTPPHG